MRVLMLGWEFPPHVSGGLGTACYGMTRALASRGTDILFVLPCLLSASAEPAGASHKSLGESPASAQRRPPTPSDQTENQASTPAKGSTTVQSVGTIPARVSGQSTATEAVADTDTSREDAAAAARLHLLSASSVFTSEVGGVQAAEASRRINREISREMSHEVWEEHVRIHPVSSSLFAYATPESYQERFRETNVVTETSSVPERSSAHPSGSAQTGTTETKSEGQGYTGAPPGDSSVPPSGDSAYTLKGGYGPDLMTEVYRFGEAAGAIALREDFDVIHVHDWMTYPAGIAAKRLTGKPLVAHIHATEYDRSGLNINREVARIEQAGMMAADRVVAVSHYTRELIMRRYGIPADKISVVHNAVARSEAPAAYHVPSGCEYEKRVLFMGRVTYQKGPEYFVEAAHLVLRRMPGVRFVMAGSGDMLSRMVRRVAQLRMGSRFHFTGFLKGGMVDQMYATSDLYVMPSVSEPFGIAPLEAMVYDTPVLLSRQSGVAEVVKNALKVDFWDIREMANKICAVLAYPRLASAVVANCREELKSIKWENSADLLNVIYRNVCSRRD